MSYRGVSSFRNLGGQVVMRRTAAARRHLLIFQNLGGQLPPCPLDTYAPVSSFNILLEIERHGIIPTFNFLSENQIGLIIEDLVKQICDKAAESGV